MDPNMMMMMASLLSSAMGAATGNKGEQKSSYNKGQLQTMDDIMKAVRGGAGGQAQDITQNPMYQQGSEWLTGLMGNSPEFWNKFEAPMMRQFEEETMPGVANRFASQGSGGSLGSTGFRNQAVREGGNLQTNLAALRGGMQQQGVGQSLQYAQQPVSNWMQQLQSILQPTQNIYQPPSAGGWGSMAAPLMQGAVQGYLGQSNPGQAASTT
jgi:hypothetical protein